MESDEIPTPSLADLGERQIYTTLLKPRYQALPSFGDDCAALGRDRVVTTDSCPTPLVACLGITDPYYAGWLLATINLSDLAAAGAMPEGLVVNYTLPSSTLVRDFKRIMDGVDACAAKHGTRVLGGDIRDGRELNLSATAIGRCVPRHHWLHPRLPRRRLSRRGARAGDQLLLIGSPGYLWAAALIANSWASLSEAETRQVWERACRPCAQLRAGQLLASRDLAHAAIDISDGLYASVRILCATNTVGACMRANIELDPVLRKVCDQAKVSSFKLGQTWGDWSLLVAVAPGNLKRALTALERAGCHVRAVGTLTADSAIVVESGDGGQPAPWVGIDQERFSPTSWHGDRINDYITWLRD
jgi:thiamine-monophosphate kinase